MTGPDDILHKSIISSRLRDGSQKVISIMSGEGASNPPDLHDISRDRHQRKLTLITKYTHRIPIKITISTSVSQGQCFVTPSIILRFSCIIYTAMRGERKSR